MKSFVVPSDVGNVSFANYLISVVWPLAYWRTNGVDVLQTAIALRLKLDNVTAGETVVLADKEAEELSKKIGMPEMAMMPVELTSASWAFAYAVLSAKPVAGTV